MGLSLEKIQQKQAAVGVLGLGYVGLPLSLVFAKADITVLGFDVNRKKIEQLQNGHSYLKHLNEKTLKDVLEKKLFFPTNDFSKLSSCDAIIICVPTPLKEGFNPDLHFIEDAAQTVASYISPKTLVSLESTTWPGTTEEVLLPLLEKTGRVKLGKDLYLCYSPEREDPGNTSYEMKTIPKLISGADKKSLELGLRLYASAFEQMIPLQEIRIAEMAKLFENTFRFVNIGLVNELKVICDHMHIDIWQVIEAAATKPFGFMPFWPGAGVGGHCLPIDPYYLKWKAKEYGASCKFIEIAGQINALMPSFITSKIQACLQKTGKQIKGAKVLLLGIAYKANSDDLRESPSLHIMKHLCDMGAIVDYSDPSIETIEKAPDFPQFAGKKSRSLSKEYDCFVLLQPHSDFSPKKLLSFGIPIVDSCHSLPNNPLVATA